MEKKMEEMKERLFKSAMKSKWEEVVKIYEEDRVAHTVQITRLGHTAVHMAVSEAEEDVVEKLVKAIREFGTEALSIRDKRGYTPLHLAAAVGNLKICESIVSADKSLIGSRNQKGETPLFRSVLHSQRDVFNLFRKHILFPLRADSGLSYCTRLDGHNILHCAIFGEDFELAIEIIDLYNQLVNRVDESGRSPLHILATKPSCFKTGINTSMFKRKKLGRSSKEEMIDRRTKRDIEAGIGESEGSQALVPQNCAKRLMKFLSEFIVIDFRNGLKEQSCIKIQEQKQASQLLEKLLEHSTIYDNVHTGEIPDNEMELDAQELLSTYDEEDRKKMTKPETRESAILVAAKNGVLEMVQGILERFPVAIHEKDKDRKNLLLIAAEYRQLELYKFLMTKAVRPRDFVVRKTDNFGNTALHFAATLKENSKQWPIPGAALQMQWEIKWFKFVEKSMPRSFSARPNKKEETPEEIFTDTHKKLLKAGGKWLTTTASQCLIVATLIATVAFASFTTVPGGNSESGEPALGHRVILNLFTISSLIALCFSVTSFIMFLSILTSTHEEKDFAMVLPRKLLSGLTSLFISIVAMLTSFCSGHFVWLEDEYKYAAYLVYIVAFLPISIFAAAQLPLYVTLAKATFRSPF